MKVVLIAYLLGIVTHSLFFDLDISNIIWLLLILSLCALCYSLSLFKKVLSTSFFFVAGLLVFQGVLPKELPFVDMDEQHVELVGQVVSEAIDRSDYTQFVLEVTDMERVLVKTSSLKKIRHGDKVTVSGKLVLPKSFETDSGRIFNYPLYLQKDGIFSILSFAQVVSVSERELSLREHVVRWLYGNKQHLISVAKQRLPEPHAGLLAGILFGQQGAMSKKVDQQFRNVGLTHIVVLSGYNVSLVIQLFLVLLNFLPLRARSVLAFIGIIAFALLVGAGPTVVRASIMASLLVLAQLVGRKYDVIRALVFAGVVMVTINPYILLFDISFQLSFLATFSLIYVSPLIEKYFTWVPEILELRASLIATISAQIFVLPLIFYQIGEFSAISLLVNTIVLFAVPWAMLFGFMLTLVPSGIVATTLGFFTYIFLEYIVALVSYCATFSLISIPPFSLGVLGIAYLILFGTLYMKRR